MTSRKLIPVAEIARPHGVRGELKLRVYNPDSSLLSTRKTVRLRMPDGEERDLTLTSVRQGDKSALVKAAGVVDRDGAEALRGAIVCVPRDAFAPIEEGEFYACDLEGARVVLKGAGEGETLGRVAGVQSYPTCDVLLVAREGSTQLEVPLTDAYVASVDVEGALVELVTVDGLT